MKDANGRILMNSGGGFPTRGDAQRNFQTIVEVIRFGRYIEDITSTQPREDGP